MHLLRRLEHHEATSVTAEAERRLRLMHVGFKDDREAMWDELDVAENEVVLFFVDPIVEHKYELVQ